MGQKDTRPINVNICKYVILCGGEMKFSTKNMQPSPKRKLKIEKGKKPQERDLIYLLQHNIGNLTGILSLNTKRTIKHSAYAT